MMSKRMDDLLKMSAEAFADMRNPFETDSLVRHSVTLDECGDLSELIACILKGYLHAPKDLRMQIQAAYAFGDSGLDVSRMLDGVRMDQLTKKIKNA